MCFPNCFEYLCIRFSAISKAFLMPIMKRARKRYAGGGRGYYVLGGKYHKMMRVGPAVDAVMSNAVRGPFGKNRGRQAPRTKFAKAVVRVMNKYAEQKVTFRQLADNLILRHNNIINIDNNAFYTQFGTRGEDFNNDTGSGTRIGKKIFLKGIKVSMNLEALQKRPQTTFWLYLVKNKLDPDEDITVQSEMYEGRSTTLPIDYIDTDKVDIMYCKKFVLRMPNQATSSSMGTAGFAPLAENAGAPEYKGVVTNPQRIAKFYVKINKTITYRDHDAGAAQYVLPVAYQRYQWLMVSYDNYSSISDTANADSHIGNLHMTTKLLFTDV